MMCPTFPKSAAYDTEPGLVTAYLSLGSNLGDRKQYLTDALQALSDSSGIQITGVSSLYETDPVGLLDQPPFLNCVIRIETKRPALDLLTVCQSVENRLGRKRDVRWGPRTIDIDLLIYDDLKSTSKKLTLPHPRMTERAFVMIPLRELQSGCKIEDPGVRCVEKKWYISGDQQTSHTPDEP